VDIEMDAETIQALSMEWVAAESAKNEEGSLNMLWHDAVMLLPN